MILGIDGRYIFVALILMIKATDSRFFFFPPHLETLCIGPFFFFLPKLIRGYSNWTMHNRSSQSKGK